MPMSTTYAESMLDHIFSRAALTSPSAVYLGLGTGTTPDSPGEISGNGYSRQAISFNAPSGGTATNSAQVQFTASGGNWSNIRQFLILDASSGGSVISASDQQTPFTVNNGDSVTVAAGDYEVGFDTANDHMSDYLAGKIIDHLYRNTSYTQPSLYVALNSSEPTGSTTGTELTSGTAPGYAREGPQSVSAWYDAGTLSAKHIRGAIGSSAEIHAANYSTWDGGATTWPTVTHVVWYDAATGGNLLFWTPWPSSQQLALRDTFRWNTQGLYWGLN